VEQLTSIARVSRELNSMIDLKSLLDIVHDEALRATHAECGTILLFDPDDSSVPPPVTLSLGCPHPEGFSALEEKVITTGEPELITDYTVEAYPPIHEGVRSPVLVPITAQGKSAGLIYLHSSQPNFSIRRLWKLPKLLPPMPRLRLGMSNVFRNSASDPNFCAAAQIR